MKALILHGTDATHRDNWFPWLKDKLEKLGYEVWVPDLPQANQPNTTRYTSFLLSKNWDFENSLMIGHSAGAVEILDLLQNLPSGVKINTAILVAPFLGDLGWPQLRDLKNLKFDYQKIKQSAKNFIVLHSDNDPYCPIEHAEEIAVNLGTKLTVMQGMKHFGYSKDPDNPSGYPEGNQFPELLQIIKAKVKV